MPITALVSRYTCPVLLLLPYRSANVAAVGVCAYTALPFESYKSTTIHVMAEAALVAAPDTTLNETVQMLSGTLAVTLRDWGLDGDAVIMYSLLLTARTDAAHTALFTLIPVMATWLAAVSNFRRKVLIE